MEVVKLEKNGKNGKGGVWWILVDVMMGED